MLAEAFAWLLSPCTPEARRLGYLREAIALCYRARRCRAQWSAHLQHSRDFLLAAAEQAVGPGTVSCAAGRGRTGVILGSGLWLDVPVEVLARSFTRLLLVDMVHLPEIRRRAARLPGVVLLEFDVSGVVRPLFDLPASASPAALAPLFNTEPVWDFLGAEVDWLASVNLWSQLPLLPLAWVERCWPDVPEACLLAWQDGLLRAHLNALQQLARAARLGGHGPQVCLLTDTERELRAGDGRQERMDYRPWLAQLGPPQAAWPWLLQDARESGDGRICEHQVGGWRL